MQDKFESGSGTDDSAAERGSVRRLQCGLGSALAGGGFAVREDPRRANPLS